MAECSDGEEEHSFSSCAELFNELLTRIDGLTNQSRCPLVCIGKDIKTIEVNLYATMNEYLNTHGYNRFTQLYDSYISRIAQKNAQIKKKLSSNNLSDNTDKSKSIRSLENNEERSIAQQGKKLLLRIQELNNALKELQAENRSIKEFLNKPKEDDTSRVSTEEVIKVKNKRQAVVASELKQNKILKQYKEEIKKITNENKEIQDQIIKLREQLKGFEDKIKRRTALYNSSIVLQINKPKQKPAFSPRRLPDNPLPPIPKDETKEESQKYDYEYEEDYEYEYEEEETKESPPVKEPNLPLKPPEKVKYVVSMPTLIPKNPNPRAYLYFPSHPTTLQDPWIKRKLAMAEVEPPEETSEPTISPGEEILNLIGKFRVILKNTLNSD